MGRTHVQAIVLAAGKSTRFKSETTKLLFTLCGQEMILYPLNTLQELGIPTTLVLGYKKEQIKKILEQHSFDAISYSEQPQQRGTGDAVAATLTTWYAEHILVMNGDMPLISAKLVSELIEEHLSQNASMSFVISHTSGAMSAQGYGRLVTQDGVSMIVEARDFKGDPYADCFVNAGIYIFKKDFLKTYITTLTTHENSHEMYLTDLVQIASRQKLPIATVTAPFDIIRGVNTLKELWAAEQIKRSEIIEHWMSQGVRFTYAQSIHLDINVSIGAGTCIEAGVQLLNGTRIGKHARIGAYSCIKNSVIHDHVTILGHTVISDATIGERALIGPFAHVHANSTIGSQTVIGNFVEVKKSVIGQGTKIKHLSYIGNGNVGSQVQIGAGTIFCNFDGFTKHTTVVEDHAFIGSNNALVAPVTIGEHAITAAGSVITEDVPPHTLAIARAIQVNKEGYAHKLRNSIAVAGAIKTHHQLT